VPDPVKGEFTNIGVVLREVGHAGAAPAQIRFTRDWSRVRCMDADADIGLLEALEVEMETRLRMVEGTPANGDPVPKPVLAMIEDSFSNSIQMSEARACLAENVAASSRCSTPSRLRLTLRRPRCWRGLRRGCTKVWRA